MQPRESFPQSGTHLRRIVVSALVLFALAGIMSGFAFGAAVHHRSGASQPTPSPTVPTIAQHTTTPTPTPSPVPILLGIPRFAAGPTFSEVADGQTSYTVTVQAIDKQGQAINRSGVTCKLWLVHRVPDGALLQLPDIGKRMDLASIQQPIPGQVKDKPYDEVAGLQFSAGTPQTQPCDSQGRATWTYTISPGVQPGKYDLVLLTDWQGIHYNWSWAHIVITKTPGQGPGND
ncbi:hypothetical protein [Thermogemmatispora tikiterensis]|uniref:Uncharacterized protein n=1 Tax=Thermogemmatispora tikiterensis TaxID=1825093 RepID=A0A328VDF9_9CHLR|nr:hypothetical protein [Thermogemmatispora tikiterensis]RAQ95788.1 hypothetical protein A4R35_09595 [Thermogemmatispora tikiterensis]